MKCKRMLALLAAMAMLTVTGCTARNNNNSNPAASSSVADIVSEFENGISDLESRVEEGISDIEDGLGMDFGQSDTSYDDESDWDGHYSVSMVEEDTTDDDMDNESVAAAMSTDFSEIGALDAEKKGWGPGGPVDTQNRPEGSTVYQQKYREHNAYFIAPNSNKIYLTFDEGYENGYTASILDTLKEKNVKAVFFITYDYAKAEPDLVKRMIAEGHIVGNHSTKHLSFPDMDLQAAAEDIMFLHDYVKAQFGIEMHLFRPPMGEFSEQTLALANSLGYKSVFWSFAYRDWEIDNQPLTIEAIDNITKKAHPGAIYLLHAVSKTNDEILGEVIDILQGQGYEFTRWDW